MIVLHATFPIDPDRRDEALDLIRELAEKSQNEDGVIDYQVWTSIEDPNLFRVTEQYDDEAAFAAHGQSEHFAEFEAKISELLAGEPEITRFDVESASVIEL